MKILSNLANVCEGLISWPVCLEWLWVSLRRLLLLVGDKLGKLHGIINVQADFLLVWGSGLLVRPFGLSIILKIFKKSFLEIQLTSNIVYIWCTA